MLDKRLIHSINSGRCFVLVGSGPSCEVGYPSWHSLASQTYETLLERDYNLDKNSYKKYLEQKKYPELFRQAELDIGDRQKLIDIIQQHLNPSTKKNSFLYELICTWPFACYLTTNYDDEIALYLNKKYEHFEVIRNRKSDFSLLRDGANHLIQKIHSDLNHIDEVVLTSSDYQLFYVEDAGQYFRDKLRQVFEMFNFFIIGHSLSDPDIEYVLQLARKTASPQHPIYMAAADYTNADEREYLEKYNIVLVRYSNSDGTHSELQRMLKATDRFIVSRSRRKERGEIKTRSKEELETTTALYLYRRLNEIQDTDNLSPLILTDLFFVNDKEMSKEEIVSLPTLKKFSVTKNAIDAIDESLHSLVRQGLVIESNGRFLVSKSGQERVKECQTVRETEKDKAFGQFCLNLKSSYIGITDKQLDKCRKLAEKVIVASFDSRGLTIANQVFAGQSASYEELSDIFGYVSDIARELDGMELKAAFVEAMHTFLVEPNHPQREYLASVSQGFFLYHLLGLDPKCIQLRRDIFNKTLWLFDSSVLLPFLAVGCHNYDYASELFKMLTDAKAVLYTTPNLLKEAWDHFRWASDFMNTYDVRSSAFLQATLVKGSYKQNLFLDGYIRLSAEGRVGSFKDYLELIFPQGKDQSSFEAYITQAGLRVINVSDIDGFIEEDWGEIEEAKTKIKNHREEQGTFRTKHQVLAEAEVWIFLKNLRSGKYSLSNCDDEIERFYFVSQSRILDREFQPRDVSTWTPEALFRYVTALPGKQTNPDLLQQCMLHEYYYAGISFIDKERYIRFFGPSINTAKISYEQEKTKYISEIEKNHAGNLDEVFNNTPDLDKPFFVAQMGWKIAEKSKRSEEFAKKREQDAKRRAELAEARVKQLELEKDEAWKKREKRKQEQEVSRLQNLQDPKHIRKRKKQAKKRSKQKRK